MVKFYQLAAPSNVGKVRHFVPRVRREGGQARVSPGLVGLTGLTVRLAT